MEQNERRFVYASFVKAYVELLFVGCQVRNYHLAVYVKIEAKALQVKQGRTLSFKTWF